MAMRLSALAAALLSLHGTEGAFQPAASRSSASTTRSLAVSSQRRVMMMSVSGDGISALEAELATTRAEVRGANNRLHLAQPQPHLERMRGITRLRYPFHPLALSSLCLSARSQAWAARCEARDLRQALDVANAKIVELELRASGLEAPSTASDDAAADGAAKGGEGESDAALFDAIDDNGDGVLTREEFTKGYALFLADVASESFDVIDADGSGTIDRDEFKKGFALLTSDSARAAAEREKIEAAVAKARAEATKEAAMVLAQAELMDVLNGAGVLKGVGNGVGNGAAASNGRERRTGGKGGPPLRKWGPESDASYSLYGPLPPGFDARKVEHLLADRCAAKAKRDFGAADALQDQLVALGVRIDDRWRTWSHAATLAAEKERLGLTGAAGDSSSSGRGRGAGRGGGRGGGRGRRSAPKRVSPGEQRWREGARPNRRPVEAAAAAGADKKEAAAATA
jgi:hypothetical protein